MSTRGSGVAAGAAAGCAAEMGLQGTSAASASNRNGLVEGMAVFTRGLDTRGRCSFRPESNRAPAEPARPGRPRQSAARVVLRMQLFHALARDVRVDLGGRQVAVPEQ